MHPIRKKAAWQKQIESDAGGFSPDMQVPADEAEELAVKLLEQNAR